MESPFDGMGTVEIRGDSSDQVCDPLWRGHTVDVLVSW